MDNVQNPTNGAIPGGANLSPADMNSTAPSVDGIGALAGEGAASLSPAAPPSTDVSGAMQTAQTPTPTPPQKVAINPNAPHAKLMSMIQSLAVGVSAFGTAIGTGGREGGVKEVMQYQQQKEQEKRADQQQQQNSSEHDLRMKTMDAQLLMSQMQYQHAMMTLPLQLKEAQLNLQNATVDAFSKVKSTGEDMGYDMSDPTQSAEANKRLGIGSADTQPGALVVPFSGASDTGAVMKTMSSAVPSGKSLSEYKILPHYADDKHGTGGTITLVPNDAPIMSMPATPKQITTAGAEIDGMLAQAKALGLDNNDAFKNVAGQYNTIKQALASGGKVSAGQLFTLHQSTLGPLSQLVASAAKAQEDAKKVAETTTAQAGAIDATAKAGDIKGMHDEWLKSKSTLPYTLWAAQREASVKTGTEEEIKSSWAQKNEAAKQELTSGSAKDGGKLLASGVLTLADMRSRGLTPKFILESIKEAQNINPKYNASDEIVGEQLLKNTTNATFFGSARSLTDVKGVLNQVSEAHKAMGNGKIPAFNSVKNVIDWHTNSPEQAAYKAAVLSAADDAAKVMGGGTPTDSLRDNFIQTFSKNLSQGGIDAAVAQVKKGVVSQVKGRIGSNNYLRQRLSDIEAGAQQSAPQQGAQANQSGMGVSLSQARLLPAYKGLSDEKIIADITKHGHKVMQ